MGRYADKHGGNSFGSDWWTAVTHPFTPGKAIMNKYQAQADFKNTIASTNALQAAANKAQAEAQAISASSAFKWIMFGLGLVVITIGGIFVYKKYFKKKKTA